MSLAKLAETPEQPWSRAYVACSALLSQLGLAVLVVVRVAAPQGPARMMGSLAAVMYGIIVLLGAVHPTVTGFWMNAVAHVVLAMALASAVSLLVGLLVAPSLASDEVVRLTAEALRGAGAIISYHTSVLMATEQASTITRSSSSAAAAAASGPKAAANDGRMIIAAGDEHPSSRQPPQQQWQAGGSWPTQQQAAGHTATRLSSDGTAGAYRHGTLDWVDQQGPAEVQGAAGLAASVQYSSHKGTGGSSRSTRSSRSLSLSLSSLSLSSIDDMIESSTANNIAAVDAAELQISSPAQHADKQQHRLEEQLLLDPSHDSEGNFTAAWVATAAVLTHSRQTSLSQQPSIDSEGPLGAFAAAQAPLALGESASSHGGQRRSLDLTGAASLEFAAEMDDKAFLEVMRTLSKSRPYGSTASLHSLGQQQGSNKHSAPKSAPSVVSTAGSVAGAVQAAASKRKQQGDAASRPASGGSLVFQASGQQQQGSTQGSEHGAASREDSSLRHGSRGSFFRELAAASLSSLRQLSCSRQHSRQESQQQQQKQQQGQQQQQHSHPKLHKSGTGLVSHVSHVSWGELPPRSAASAAAAAGAAAAGAVHAVAAAGDVLWHDDSNLQQQQLSTTASSYTATDSSHPDDFGKPLVPPAADSAAADRSAASKESPCLGAVPEQAAPTTAAQLGPIIGRAKAALAAARLEPACLRPEGFVGFNADAWGQLLEDAELLLVRVSTLEALSEERRLQGLVLHHLQHYRNIADAMAMTLAQLAAFLAHVAKAVQQQQASRHVSGLPAWLARWGGHSTPAKQQQRPSKHPSKQQHGAQHQTHSTPHYHNSVTASPFGASPFGAADDDCDAAAAVEPELAAAGDVFEGQAHDTCSLSGILSAMERAGSGVSSYLWEKKTGWETGRQLLQREMEAAVGGYWWSVRRASRKAPVKVPKAREVMTLTFVWPVTNGLLDAMERIESSAQQVMRGQQHSPTTAPGGSSSGGGSSRRPAATMVAARKSTGITNAKWLRRLLTKQQQQQQQPQTALQQQQQQQWAKPLGKLLLVQPGWQAVKQVVTKDLPDACSSKQGFATLLKSRTFQAGMKLYLATGSALLLTLLLMAYVPAVHSVAPIFGFTSVCLSMQERVEATTNKVVGRVLGTIVGASLGLAVISIPGVFESPLLLLVCLGAASVPLSMAAQAEARVGVALALLTLLAVTLCTYEVVCCTAATHLGATQVFLARLGSVVGACIYVGLLNRLLLPWFTSDYSLEQMADALEQAAGLFEKIYLSQYNRMRVAAVAAGAIVDAGGEDSMAGAVCAAGAAASDPGHNGTAAALGDTGAAPPGGTDGGSAAAAAAAAAAELSSLEAAEAGLHVALRQEVLRRVVEVQLSLAKDSVGWKRGMLATPQVVLDVLGALVELVEALASQRLALAPFTREGTTVGSSAAGGGAAAPAGLLRVSGHCYSVWAQPLHPLWLEILAAVHDLAQATAQQLRRTPAAAAAGPGACHELLQKLSRLEECRLQMRQRWLAIRMNLHKRVHDGSSAAAAAAASGAGAAANAAAREAPLLWPTDSVHFFTFTYGASRVLNKLAGVTQAALSAWER